MTKHAFVVSRAVRTALKCALFLSAAQGVIGCGSGPRPAGPPQAPAPDSARLKRVPVSAKLPLIPNALPIIKLKPQAPPIDYMTKVMSELVPNASLEPLSGHPLYENAEGLEALSGFVQDERLLGWVNRDSGDAQIYPVLSGLSPLRDTDSDAARSAAQRAFEGVLLGDRITRFEIVGPRTLAGVEASGSDSDTNESNDFLYYFAARRFVGNLPVYGNGSRASVAVGANGVVQGLNLRWRVASEVRRVGAAISTHAQLDQRISDEFAHLTERARVDVSDVELVYFDYRDYLQPAFRVVARLRPLQPANDLFPRPDTLVTSYIHFGDPVEPLPGLRRPGTRPDPIRPPPGSDPAPDPIKPPPRPGPPPMLPMSARAASAPANVSSSLRVGRYVASGVTSTFEQSATSFWQVLQSGGSSFQNGEFTLATTQAMFLNDRVAHVGANDLVLVEAHGSPGLVFTDGHLKGVEMKKIAPMNLGRNASDWIIHSCRVVSSAVDTAKWADHWWPVMHDVRAVVGYRTDVVISDGATPAYAAKLRLFAPIVSSWINELSALPEYLDPPPNTEDPPAGRASAVVLCKHKDDSLAQRVPSGPPTCLLNWYVRN